MAGTLYLVGTPIGSLEDISERARRTLAAADVIAAEDTRRSGLMLKRLGIQARLVSFFEANEAERMPQLLDLLRKGRDVAVVSDAGMPGISDPGYRLVSACVADGIPVDVVPGPSAAVAALVVSGLPTDRFVFEGFLPRSGKARAQRLAALAIETRTAVLFESPRRLERTLEDLLARCGDRRVAVARELTKLHQEILRGRLSEVVARLRDRTVRGEVVLVLEGGADRAAPEEDALALAAELVNGGMRKRQAARLAANRTGVPARRIYEHLAGAELYGAAGSNRGAPGRRATSSE